MEAICVECWEQEGETVDPELGPTTFVICKSENEDDFSVFLRICCRCSQYVGE